MAIEINFVSDVACPWCAIGLASLESALGRIDDLEVGISIERTPADYA